MKKPLTIFNFIMIPVYILLFSCQTVRDSNYDEHSIKDDRLGRFILHDDFGNLLIASSEPFGPGALEAAAREAATSGADIISLRVSDGEKVFFYPSIHGESYGIDSTAGYSWWFMRLSKLVYDGRDPYGIVLEEIRRHDVPVLAKFRVNDRHHVAGWPQRASRFWQENPQWYIEQSEKDADMLSFFHGHPSIGPNQLIEITSSRPQLLDYAIAEVREKRLAIFREVIERYDVAGATLHFLRTPYCVSLPGKNAGYLTEFVRQCRQILDEVLGARGVEAPILGALLPWDIDFCRAMGIEVDTWISEGLLDYISPSEGWVTNFNMDIQPWVDLTRGTRCAVHPGVTGMIAFNADFCLPRKYKIERGRVNSAKIMPEHVRALAHRFYGEGANGLSSFNLYSLDYSHLFPLSYLVSPDRLDAGERSYAYMRGSRYYGEWNFLQLILPADASESRPIHCRIHERLNGAQAHLRFKARGLEDMAGLTVSVNGRKIPSGRLTSLTHFGSGFMYLQCQLEPGDIRDGNNEITFSLNRPAPAVVIVQEIEIRVKPLSTGNRDK